MLSDVTGSFQKLTMMKYKVGMLLSNPFRPDPRVLKEARSLTQAGYGVTVICWDRQGEFAPQERVDDFEIRRLAVRSGYAAGSCQMLFLPRFWWHALRELSTLNPDIVHCHDLDTAPAAYWYARTHRVPWIFDSHECYPAAIGPQVNRAIHRMLLLLERQMAQRATHVITVGELLAQRFRSFGGRVSVVGNYQSPDAFVPQGSISRQKIGLQEDDFIIMYIGGFTMPRALLPLIEATATVEDAVVVLLGDGPQREAIEAMLPGYPRVHYLGWVSQEQVPDYTALADVVYYGLDTSHSHSQYSAPNALFNALAAGKPLLTSDVGEIADIVKSEQCGVVVKRPTPELLAQAMMKLRDSSFRLSLAANARRAGETKYNWAVARSALLMVYQQLVD
jgi:glycosyltransferase involved in cell wall biosynthesis